MDTDTAVMEAPPSSAPNPASTPPRQSLAEANAEHEQFMKTGKMPDKAPVAPPAKSEAKPAAEAAPSAKDAKSAAPAVKKPTGLEALKGKPAANGTEKPAAEAKADDEKPGEQSRWMELKAKEKRLAEIEPEYEATKKEKAEWEAKMSTVQDSLKELESLRRERDFTDVTKSDTYRKEVDAPYQKVAKIAQDVAEYAQVDARDLMKAMQEPNSLLRAKAIKAVLEGGKEEVADISELVQGGGTLQDIFARHDELHKNATTLKAQHDNQKNAEKLKADTEASEIMTRAHGEVRDILKSSGAKVLGEDALNAAFEAAQNPRNEPMDNAYRAQSEFLLPRAIEVIQEREARIKQLEEDLAAAGAAKPGIKPDAQKDAGKKADHGSLADAVAAHKTAGGHL